MDRSASSFTGQSNQGLKMFQEPKMQSMAGQMTNVMNNLMLPYNDALAAAVEAYFKSSNPTLYSTGKL